MKNIFLKNILAPLYPLLVLEDIFSHNTRLLLKKLFGGIALLAFIASLFVDTGSSQIKGVFAFTFFLWLWTFCIDAYFYSLYEYSQDEMPNIPFEVARMLYYCDTSDLTQGFLISSLGDEVFKRLEFSEEEIKEFVRSRTLVEKSLTDLFPKQMNFSVYVKTLYDADLALQELLLKKNISFKDFEGAFLWVLKKHEDRIQEERFWSKEKLSRIEGIGKNWSYGETFTLERYGRDITQVQSSHFEAYQTMHKTTVACLESVLAKSQGGNALIVSDDEASRMDVVTMLARKIGQGKALSSISKKRVFVLETNLLIESATDKISFERNLEDLLIESMKALNVIVVIPYFSSFLESAKAIGSDALSIMRPFFLAPTLSIIALDSKEMLTSHISHNASIMENFEVIQTEISDANGILSLLQTEAEKIEDNSRFFFTFLALETIRDGVRRYFDAYSAADKAKDIIIESVPFSASLGSYMITRETVLKLIEAKTGVPTEVPKGEEKSLLLNLEEVLHKRVIGQDEAVKIVSNALRRSRSGVRNPDRPIGSFLFLGPTGVGKTETTKALADTFFGSENNISRFDMSEYNGSDALSKLIGYFGSEEQGILVRKIKERPYGVVLLDEFEKTNKDVLNLFLQVLDEGQFSDSAGRSINAKNNIFIATSNAGSEMLFELALKGEDINTKKDEIIESIISTGIFKPELLNRFDAIILFHPLTEIHLKNIAKILVEKMVKRMREKSIIVEQSSDLIEYLVSKGTDPKFGARPMNRAIQNEIEQVIAERIISGDIVSGSRVSFFLKDKQTLDIKIV